MRLTSRAEHDRTAAYPEVRGLGEGLGSHQAVLDGEIIAPDPGGRPSFALSDGFGAQAIAKRLCRVSRPCAVTARPFTGRCRGPPRQARPGWSPSS